MTFPRKFFRRRALALGALASCLGLFGSVPGASGEIAATTAEPRAWSGTHGALAGPMIGPEWFQDQNTIVYLLPQGAELSSIRTAAAQIMQEEWVAGKHGIKHIFISNVGGRLRFAARQRIAVNEITEQVTLQAGQDLEYSADNLPFVREQVFFVWDPQADLWSELVGPSAAEEPQLKIVLLDQHGAVVETIDPATLDPEPELGQLPEFVTEVREAFAASE